MERIVSDGVCPFCQENLHSYHSKPIIWQDEHWLVTENEHPYRGAKQHFLLIAKRHQESATELTAQESVSFFQAIKKITEDNGIPGATIIIRSGEMNYTGASVRHLHAHLIVGVEETQTTAPIRVKIGYGE